MTYIVHYQIDGNADRVRGVDAGAPGTGANTPLADSLGKIVARGGTVTRVECVSPDKAVIAAPPVLV